MVKGLEPSPLESIELLLVEDEKTFQEIQD
jgi:hypothetical protein